MKNEQTFFTVMHVQGLTWLFVFVVSELLTGWWRVSYIEELRALVDALHTRGIREKGLQRQMQKYMEMIPQVCTKHKDGKCGVSLCKYTTVHSFNLQAGITINY